MRYAHAMPVPPVALSIAGSDCSSGAGIQADLKTFQHFHVHGLTAVTCVVSETAKTVAAIHPVPADLIESQVSLLLESFPVAAIKTGMLHSAEVIARVAHCLQRHPGIPLVVDPVMIASSGASLLEADAIDAYRTLLFPRATLITPNLPEAECLHGTRIHTLDEMQAAAIDLSRRFSCAVLLKGGHLDQAQCTDLLVVDKQVHPFTATRIDVAESHGTGCTLSAAICAGLSHRHPLVEATRLAKDYLGDCLRGCYHYPMPDGHSLGCLDQGTRSRSDSPPTA